MTLLLAFLYKGKATVTNKKFDWEAEDYLPENDPFMQQFDADGKGAIAYLNLAGEIVQRNGLQKATN